MLLPTEQKHKVSVNKTQTSGYETGYQRMSLCFVFVSVPGTT
jgi:hypothetical protein